MDQRSLRGPRPPRRWRLWLLRLLLLLGALYAALLVCWDASRLDLLQPSVAPSSSSKSKSSVASSVDLAAVPHKSPAELTQEAELHARSVKMLTVEVTGQRNWRCIGWRATGDCSPHGPREPQNDQGCQKRVPNEESGYCEVEDVDSGERFRVMRRYCNSLRQDAHFRCKDAASFINFPLEAQKAVNKAHTPEFTLPNVNTTTRDGIVMVVYPKLLASAYATIKTLREALDCQLPIEIWFRPKELFTFPAALASLQELADNPSYRGDTTFHEINDAWATGFGTKVFAIYHSFFERVLFLDADNVPVRDPSYLFASPEFSETGAVFWPDFWHPKHTIFNVHGQSLLWQMLDMPFVNMFEQESGQLLVDRRRHAVPLELVFFYAFHQPNHFTKFKLVHGDKDLFRLAWLKLKTPFHMIETPPAVAGKVINDSFCGMTMVQHDPQGEVLFLHRNSNKLTGGRPRKPMNERLEAIRRERNKRLRIQKGLKGSDGKWEKAAEQPKQETLEADGYPDPAIWTHLLSFRNTSRRVFYVIDTYNADPEFSVGQNCYGQRHIGSNKHFYAQEIANLSFAGLETDIRRFALEAVQLRQTKANAVVGGEQHKESMKHQGEAMNG